MTGAAAWGNLLGNPVFTPGMRRESSDMADMGQAVRVAIGVVLLDDHVLVGIREAGGVLAGKHEFPGGKCEQGETPEACVVRECLEETGLKVAPFEVIDQRRHVYPHGSVELHFILCRLSLGADPAQTGRFRWIPVAKLNELDFPEANRDVVARLTQGRRTMSFEANRARSELAESTPREPGSNPPTDA